MKTKAFLREKVRWPGIDKQAESLIKSCHACQPTAQPSVKCEPLKVSEIPKSPYEVIALDLQGPYQELEDIFNVWITYDGCY